MSSWSRFFELQLAIGSQDPIDSTAKAARSTPQPITSSASSTLRLLKPSSFIDLFLLLSSTETNPGCQAAWHPPLPQNRLRSATWTNRPASACGATIDSRLMLDDNAFEVPLPNRPSGRTAPNILLRPFSSSSLSTTEDRWSYVTLGPPAASRLMATLLLFSMWAIENAAADLRYRYRLQT
jgi:hypothetical protein